MCSLLIFTKQTKHINVSKMDGFANKFKYIKSFCYINTRNMMLSNFRGVKGKTYTIENENFCGLI